MRFLAVFLLVGAGTLPSSVQGTPRTGTSSALPAAISGLVPEAERSLKRVILGLAPNSTKLFLLPETAAWEANTKDPRVRWLRRQLYRLNFELEHGQIFRHAPPYARFFIAVPDPRTTPESLGNEEAIFREHLRERVGWSDRVIDERVRFFTVPIPVVFPQDMAEPIGYDERGRLVLGLGADGDDHYRSAVESLAAAHPEDFVIRRLPGINTEGGDLALVRLPEGGVGLLIGRNRVARYVARRHPDVAADAPIPETYIDEARRAYQRALGGIEAIVIGREALRDPRLANPEIFHIDMLLAVLKAPSGVVAFVPTYEGIPIDALSHVELSADSARRFQNEFDRTARQLASRGFRVARVPFADHPARSPVGIGKFLDPVTGEPNVLLGRYPAHLEPPDDRNPQTRLQIVFQELDASVADWRHDPTDSRWGMVQAGIAKAWRQMDAAIQAPNSLFESQKRTYESFGIRVRSLPIFPTGEGGVHCLVLK
jgi:hypothetical protein